MDWSDIEGLFSLGDDTSSLMMLVWILPVILFVFYGQRIQLLVSSGEIKKNIKKLDGYGAASMEKTLSYVRGLKVADPDSERRIRVMADYFTIPPVDMDPTGVVAKVRHVVRSRETLTKAQVETMLGRSDGIQTATVQTLLEVTASLRLVHRVVNHMYLTAKKQNNYPLILPLQMMLPFVMEEAEAMMDAMGAFSSGQPVGDAVGPTVLANMMRDLSKESIAHQTVCARAEMYDRRVILVKADGPAPVVGRPDEALHSIIREGRPAAIIMVDAALKMEGEESGSVSRGFGAAIGGTGAERFRIEEVASKYDIPVYSVVVKQSVKESITLMTSPIYGAVAEATSMVSDIIREDTVKGRAVVVIGVGNTGGVGQ